MGTRGTIIGYWLSCAGIYPICGDLSTFPPDFYPWFLGFCALFGSNPWIFGPFRFRIPYRYYTLRNCFSLGLSLAFTPNPANSPVLSNPTPPLAPIDKFFLLNLSLSYPPPPLFRSNSRSLFYVNWSFSSVSSVSSSALASSISYAE